MALDIEHSKSHSYFGLICLIQLTVFDGEYKTFLIDVLMIDSRLIAKYLGAQIIGNERIIKVLHGCIFSDLWWLARDFGVVLNPVFDTQEIEKLVTGKKLAVSLTSLWAKYCEEAFDIQILKQKELYQKADWA